MSQSNFEPRLEDLVFMIFNLLSTRYQPIPQNLPPNAGSVTKKKAIKLNDIISSPLLCFGGESEKAKKLPQQWKPRLSIQFMSQSDNKSLRSIPISSCLPRRMIHSNPSKWYHEMWLRIGGEPRCIFCQFLFQGFVGLRFWGSLEAMSHENVSFCLNQLDDVAAAWFELIDCQKRSNSSLNCPVSIL